MDDFDDDLDDIMSQQCFNYEDDSTSKFKKDSIVRKVDIEQRLKQLEDENKALKGEVSLLRNKNATESAMQKKKQQELEVKMQQTVEQCQRDVGKLSAELDFKHIELASQRKSFQSEPDTRGNIGMAKRSSSTMKSELPTYLEVIDTENYDFYSEKKPVLKVNGTALKLSQEEKDKRMKFFCRTIQPFNPNAD